MNKGLVYALLAAAMLGGCASPFGNSPQTRFYTLDGAGSTLASRAAPAHAARLGVGPLELPDMLDRPQIVSRGDGHQLQLAEFDRWAGSLHEQALRALVRGLAAKLPEMRLDAHPWARYQQPDLQLRITVLRFDGIRGDHSVLEGNWSLIHRGSGEERIWRRFSLREPVSGGAANALVDSYAALLASLAAEIAAELVKAEMV